MSDTTIKIFINEAEQFSKSLFERKDDLILILETASQNEFDFTLDQIAFTAKYIKGLMSVVSSASGNPEIKNAAQLNSDLAANLEKFRGYLLAANEKMKNETRETFYKKYLEMSGQSFSNLKKLIEDFSLIKIFLNHKKRETT